GEGDDPADDRGDRERRPTPLGAERVGGLGRREGGDGGQDDGKGEPPEVAGDDGDDEPHDAEAHPRSVDVVDDAEARALEPGEPERLGVGAGAPGRRRGGPALGHQPPETGGSTATSSVSVTASVGSAGSPLSQTFEESTTAENRSPKRPRAASMTSPTVPPGSSTRPVPAASRAAAKSRSVATSSKCRGAP